MKKNSIVIKLNYIIIFAIVEAIVLIYAWGPIICYDTESYLIAWDSLWLGKRIDVMRTPVYPIILGMIRDFLGVENLFLYIIIIQHTVSIISISCFYKLTIETGLSKNKTIFLTFLYSIIPAVTTVNNLILTESFALSGIVFLLFTLFRVWHRVSILNTLLFTVTLLLLEFLRPAFIYLIPVFFLVFLGIVIRDSISKKAIYGTISLTFVTICLFFYMKQFEHEYGIFATSRVSTVNQLWTFRHFGLLNPDVINDNRLKKEIQDSYIKHGALLSDEYVVLPDIFNWVQEYDVKTLHEAIHSSFKSHPVQCITKCYSRLSLSAGKPYPPVLHQGMNDVGRTFSIIGLNLSNLYLFLIIYSLIIGTYYINTKKVPQKSLLYFLLGAGNLTVVVVGAPNDYGRLLLPSLPIFILMMGQLISIMSINTQRIRL